MQRVDGFERSQPKSGPFKVQRKSQHQKSYLSVSVAFAFTANIVPFGVNLPLKLPLLKDEGTGPSVASAVYPCCRWLRVSKVRSLLLLDFPVEEGDGLGVSFLLKGETG